MNKVTATTEKPDRIEGEREARWRDIASAPEGELVETKIDDADGERNVQKMTRRGRLWFIQNGMYVYYSPTHWRPAA